MATKFITVSIEIMHDKNLNQSQKFILAEIEQLQTLKHGCIASNSHFSELVGISKENVSRNINGLVKKGYIKIEVKSGSRNHERVITLTTLIKIVRPPYQNSKTPLSKQQETKGNITVNKTNNKSEAKKQFKKTLENRKENFYKRVAEHVEKYNKETLRDFYEHWIIVGDGETRMAFEKCKTWNTGKRLATWAKNNFNGTEVGQIEKKKMRVIKTSVIEETTAEEQQEVLELFGGLNEI